MKLSIAQKYGFGWAYDNQMLKHRRKVKRVKTILVVIILTILASLAVIKVAGAVQEINNVVYQHYATK